MALKRKTNLYKHVFDVEVGIVWLKSVDLSQGHDMWGVWEPDPHAARQAGLRVPGLRHHHTQALPRQVDHTHLYSTSH